MKFLLLTVVICLIYALVSVAASPLINEARRTSCAIVGTDCSTLPCCEDLTCARTPKLLCIYGRYNYSAEDVFEIKVDENETICNLVETIKQSKTGLKNAKFSKKTLDGEELTATETAIFEYFDNTELQIIILSSYHLLPTLPSKSVQSSQQTEGENSIEDDTKSVTLPKKMEEKCDSNDTSYNRNLGNPIVSIKSAKTRNEAEYLYNKLVFKKDAIDGIFESQPVYTIGSIFHENNAFPFIAFVFYQVTELSSNSGDSEGFRKMIMTEVEVVAVVEDKGANVELAAVPKITKIRYQMKKSKSTKVVSDEWISLKTQEDLIKWLYKKNTNDIKVYFTSEVHKCRESIISMDFKLLLFKFQQEVCKAKDRTFTVKTGNDINIPKDFASKNSDFDVVVSPRRTKSFKWTVNIEHATLECLKNSMYQTPALGKQWSGTQHVKLTAEKLPSNTLKGFLRLDSQLNLPALRSDELKSHSINLLSIEATKSIYVYSYLLPGPGANNFKGKFGIRPQKNISGPNGQSPLYLSVDLHQTAKTVWSRRLKKRKVNEVEEGQMVGQVYNDENMENMVGKVLSHIVWLLEEAEGDAEFKAKYDEAKDEITKLRAELRNRIEELEKARIDTVAENTRRDVEMPGTEGFIGIMAKLRDQVSQYIGIKPSEICFPITEEGRQMFCEIIADQEKMTDIVMDQLS
ncbi:hypothetical protein RhiirA5_496387 [Rhizophagus irregularis]|uniref:Uncharacterized protein n=1 Tax=Rhizophagus irregularis TaxID=588596 RepID=A0A2N0Q245_9GLOM|nr:hypothetical protein RhiirA5_496387 [Rhizophagus irregularis]